MLNIQGRSSAQTPQLTFLCVCVCIYNLGDWISIFSLKTIPSKQKCYLEARISLHLTWHIYREWNQSAIEWPKCQISNKWGEIRRQSRLHCFNGFYLGFIAKILIYSAEQHVTFSLVQMEVKPFNISCKGLRVWKKHVNHFLSASAPPVL